MKSSTKLALCAALALSGTLAQAQKYDYRLLATSRTSTMEKEMNQAAEAGGEGFQFLGVMVGKTAFGGSETISILKRVPK